MEQVSAVNCLDGMYGVFTHISLETCIPMRFSIFVPSHLDINKRLPVVWYLSGYGCDHAAVIERCGIPQACARLGLIFVAPDTYPRLHDSWGFERTAGLYVDATQPPFAENYRMYSWVVDELPELLSAYFPADRDRQAIMGHAMGGHGALVMALRNPGAYASVSAFAPIVSAVHLRWCKKNLLRYLGDAPSAWRPYDPVALIEDGARVQELLIDLGAHDPFANDEFNASALIAACAKADISLCLERQRDYNNGLGLVSGFMEDHLRWHAAALTRPSGCGDAEKQG